MCSIARNYSRLQPHPAESFAAARRLHSGGWPKIVVEISHLFRYNHTCTDSQIPDAGWQALGASFATPSCATPIDDQNPRANLDHLWTTAEEFASKPEAQLVIIYGRKDQSRTADERRFTQVEARQPFDDATHRRNLRATCLSLFPPRSLRFNWFCF
jgi:hypothetical protein